MSSIPKVIHQIWVTKDGSNASYPPRYDAIRQTLIDNNPDFEFKVWLDRDIFRLFDHPHLAPFRDVYMNMQYAISRADFARMMVMYVSGGFYSDLDFYGYLPLSGLLDRFSSHTIIVAKEFPDNNPPMLCNGFFAGTAGNSFFLDFVRYMANTMRNINQVGLHVVDTTGPRAFYLYASTRYRFEDMLVPSALILPHNKEGKLRNITEKPYVGTLWTEGTEWPDTVVLAAGTQRHKHCGYHGYGYHPHHHGAALLGADSASSTGTCENTGAGILISIIILALLLAFTYWVINRRY